MKLKLGTLWNNGSMAGWIFSDKKEKIFQQFQPNSNPEVINISIVSWHQRVGHLPVNAFNHLEKAVVDFHIL